MTVGRKGATCFAALILGALAVPAIAETLALGILAHRGEKAAHTRWSATAEYLSDALEQQVRLVPLTLEGVRSALETETLDFLLTNPGHYVATSNRFQLSPIATLRRDRSQAAEALNKYGAVIFTKADRQDIHALGDLKGKAFAAVSPDAFGGYQIAAHTLLRNGVTPDRDFKTISFLGFPQDRIVQAVLHGDVDAGTVRTGIIEAMITENRLQPDQVKVLNVRTIKGFDFRLSTDLFPEWTFAATRRASPSLKQQVAIALLSMTPQSKAAVAGRYGGWDTPMNDGNVREVMTSLVAPKTPPPPLQGSGFWLAIAMLVAIGTFGISRLYRLRARNGPGMAQTIFAEDDTRLAALTKREHQVLELIVSGQTNKEMARHLGISPKTVEFHRAHLMKKLHADTVADAVRIALASGKTELNPQT